MHGYFMYAAHFIRFVNFVLHLYVSFYLLEQYNKVRATENCNVLFGYHMVM